LITGTQNDIYDSGRHYYVVLTGFREHTSFIYESLPQKWDAGCEVCNQVKFS